MKKSQQDKLASKLVKAFLKNKIISPLPKKFTKKLTNADKFRKLCEKKIKEPIKFEEPTNITENLGQWLANQILLVEGGAYGHMSHPFDDKGLTFGDFKTIIDLSLQGNLDLEKAATEFRNSCHLELREIFYSEKERRIRESKAERFCNSQGIY